MARGEAFRERVASLPWQKAKASKTNKKSIFILKLQTVCNIRESRKHTFFRIRQVLVCSTCKCPRYYVQIFLCVSLAKPYDPITVSLVVRNPSNSKPQGDFRILRRRSARENGEFVNERRCDKNTQNAFLKLRCSTTNVCLSYSKRCELPLNRIENFLRIIPTSA